MKTIFKITALSATLLMFVGSFVSCKKKESNDIPFTEYSLFSFVTGWVWTNYFCSVDSCPRLEHVFIINSSEEFEKHIECRRTLGYPYECEQIPTIDFSKHTLLVVFVTVHGGPPATATSLTKKSKNKYALEISAKNGPLTFSPIWSVAILTSKISDCANFIITVNRN